MMASCPQTCICIWKNGKETVECINRDLGEIPEGIEPSTQVIDVRGNSIPVLEDDLFVDLGITNLQKIFVQYCKIRTVQPKAFRKLTNLVELDLGENLIQEVPSEAWKHTKALMRLNLSEKEKTEEKIYYETLRDEAFAGLESLEWLKLEDNSISSLSGEGLFPESLKGIEIHNNLWFCDCGLQDFSRWVQLTAVPRVDEPKCSKPLRLQVPPCIQQSIRYLSVYPDF